MNFNLDVPAAEVPFHLEIAVVHWHDMDTCFDVIGG
jgi:hypothetical protein